MAPSQYPDQALLVLKLCTPIHPLVNWPTNGQLVQRSPQPSPRRDQSGSSQFERIPQQNRNRPVILRAYAVSKLNFPPPQTLDASFRLFVFLGHDSTSITISCPYTSSPPTPETLAALSAEASLRQRPTTSSNTPPKILSPP